MTKINWKLVTIARIIVLIIAAAVLLHVGTGWNRNSFCFVALQSHSTLVKNIFCQELLNTLSAPIQTYQDQVAVLEGERQGIQENSELLLTNRAQLVELLVSLEKEVRQATSTASQRQYASQTIDQLVNNLITTDDRISTNQNYTNTINENLDDLKMRIRRLEDAIERI